MEVFIFKNRVQMWQIPVTPLLCCPLVAQALQASASSSPWTFGIPCSRIQKIIRWKKKNKSRKKRYQLDWLPFWSSQGLGPRNPIWEGRREGKGKRREREKQRWKKKWKGEERSYHSVNKCAASSFSSHFAFYVCGCVRCVLRRGHAACAQHYFKG